MNIREDGFAAHLFGDARECSDKLRIRYKKGRYFIRPAFFILETIRRGGSPREE